MAFWGGAMNNEGAKPSQPDWLDQKWRFWLLPRNPYFQDRLSDTLSNLGIPGGGFPDRPAADAWLSKHVATHIPSYQEPIGARLFWLEAWQTKCPDHSPTWQHLPILTGIRGLLDAFGLPDSLFKPLLKHILLGTAIPQPTTMIVEEVYLPAADSDASFGEIASAYGLYSEQVAGLPEEAGAVVVIRLLVNRYTTQSELAGAWKTIEEIRNRYTNGKRVPSKRRSGTNAEAEFDEWLRWHEARRSGLSLAKVADKFDRPEETIQYGLKQLDRLMLPRK